MKITQTTALVYIMVIGVSLSAAAEIEAVLSPFIGYAVPSSDTIVTQNGTLVYVGAGNSAAGVDVSVGPLPLGLHLAASFVGVGFVIDESNRYVDLSGGSVAIGLGRRICLGSGNIEISASYFHRSEQFVFRPAEEAWSAEFEQKQSGVAGGLRVSAPFSPSVELSLLSKIQMASEYTEDIIVNPWTVCSIQRSGRRLVFAAGLNWKLGDHLW